MPTTQYEHNEIKDIPDIPPPILESASNGKLVVFAGAGVSRIIGCLSWDDFAISQLKYLREKKCINYHEYENLSKLEARKLLSICKKILEEKNIPPPDTKSLLKCNEKLNEKYKIYDDLYSFNAIYVTTNFDDHLDQVAKLKKSHKTLTALETSTQPNIDENPNKRADIIYSKDQLLVSGLTNGSIIHLHGSVNDKSSMIITIVDYMKHYEKDSKPAVLLEEIFKAYTVLFVGYGLEEYEILEFMIGKSQAVRGELKHFMLYPIFKAESNLFDFNKKYYADLGIQLVPYLKDENGYEQLATVIGEWARQIGPLSKPQNFLDRVKLIDEVI